MSRRRPSPLKMAAKSARAMPCALVTPSSTRGQDRAIVLERDAALEVVRVGDEDDVGGVGLWIPTSIGTSCRSVSHSPTIPRIPGFVVPESLAPSETLRRRAAESPGPPPITLDRPT